MLIRSCAAGGGLNAVQDCVGTDGHLAKDLNRIGEIASGCS